MQSAGGGGVSQHAMGGGVYLSMHRAGGVSAWGDVSAQRVSVQGFLPGGV